MSEKEPTPQNVPETIEAEETGGYVVRPDGTVITKKEAEEERQRREDDPNWFREQR